VDDAAVDPHETQSLLDAPLDIRSDTQAILRLLTEDADGSEEEEG
jgi:hypothetical protein